MIEVFYDLFVVYCSSFFFGIGLYELIVPEALKSRSLFLLLPAGLGLLVISIVDAYLVYASLNVRLSLYVCAGVGTGTLILALLRNRGYSNGFLQRIRDLKSLSRYKVALFAVLLCAILAPTLKANIATTPYRIGIDQVGYAESAQFLVEGGTLERARANLLKGLQSNNLPLAEAKNIRSLNFGTYVDTEFLLKAMRWGFPGVVASLTELTGSAHAFKIEFTVLIFSYALLVGLAFHVLQRTFLLPPTIAFAGIVVLALNCNLLNVYYEGELAEIFILPYFLMMFALYSDARADRFTAPAVGKVQTILKPLLLLAFLTAGMFSAYNEAMLLFCALFYLVMLLDFCFYRRTSRQAMLMMMMGLGAGFLAVLPFSWHWFVYTVANLQGLARAGFWQPHWASLAEILGLLDMYRQIGYQLFERSIINEIASVTLSVGALAILCRFVLKNRHVDKALWIAPFIIVLVAYLKTHFIDGILNYPYMKVYTILLPLLVIPALAALYDYAQRKGPFVRYGQFLPLFTVTLTGILYIGQYLVQGHYVTRDMFSMYGYNGTRRFNEFAVVTQQQDIAEYMLSPLISMNWLNQSTVPTSIEPAVNKDVLIILSNTQLACRTCFVKRYHKQIVYKNPSYVFFNTGLTVAQFCPVDVRAYRIDATPKSWKNLPMNQCRSFGSLNLPYVQ